MRVIFTPMGMVRKFSAGLLSFLLVCSLSVIHPSCGAGGRTPVYAKNGMVSSASMLASEVGASTLQAGGNAVDAAIATALALAVTWPSAGNIGGGGFLFYQYDVCMC